MKVSVKLVVLTGTLLTTSLFAQMTWTEATDSAGWPGRWGHGTVVFNHQLWIMGGDDSTMRASSGRLLNDVWRSNDGTHWSLATDSAGWSPRVFLAPLVFGSKMWVMGGLSVSSGVRILHNDVWSSTDGVHWTPATDSAGWRPRFSHAGVVFDSMMWVMGGADSIGSQGPARVLNDVWRSSDGAHWTRVTDSAGWRPRYGHTSVVSGGRMWVMGGDGWGGAAHDVWYSTDGANWTRATDNGGWGPRFFFSALVFANKMWIPGGNGESSSPIYGDVWYSTDGAQWTQAVSHAPWPARFGQTVADSFNGDMWVMGGADTTTTFDDVWYSAGLGVAETRVSFEGEAAEFNVRPNPFQGETRLAYSPTAACPVTVSIQSISGRQVRVLVDGSRKSGPQEITWNGRDGTGRDVPAGIYFALLSTGGHTVEKKLVKLE